MKVDLREAAIQVLLAYGWKIHPANDRYMWRAGGKVERKTVLVSVIVATLEKLSK